MKTLRNKEKIVRVAEKEVSKYLQLNYKYVPKSVWKEEVRGTSKKEEVSTK